MNEEHIRSSILQYFSDEYAGDADWGLPHRFDPQEQDITEWAAIMVNVAKPVRRRRGAPKQIPFTIVIDCWSRNNADLYGATGVAVAAKAVFDDKLIPIRDYSTSDESVVGTAAMDDPASIDETDAQGQEGWQHIRVTIDGMALEQT